MFDRNESHVIFKNSRQKTVQERCKSPESPLVSVSRKPYNCCKVTLKANTIESAVKKEPTKMFEETTRRASTEKNICWLHRNILLMPICQTKYILREK